MDHSENHDKKGGGEPEQERRNEGHQAPQPPDSLCSCPRLVLPGKVGKVIGLGEGNRGRARARTGEKMAKKNKKLDSAVSVSDHQI